MTITTPAPFEGSEAAADFIRRVQAFIHTELDPLAQEHHLSHEQGAPRALLQQV